MKERIDGLNARFEEALAAVSTLDGLEAIRVEFLGKKGAIAELMKGLRDVEDKKAAGQLINTFKVSVENAVAGITDKMVGFERTYVDGKYVCNTKLFDLTVVANTEKKVPREWINESGDGMNQQFIDYALPLIQGATQLTYENGLPRFVHLKKVKVN